MAGEVATAGLPLGGVVGIVTHHSGYTTATFGEVPEKVLVPSAPVIDSMAAPVESAGIIELSITLPTTDTGANALAQSEIVKIRMHHSTSSGVDTDDSYVDFPPGVTLTWTPGDLVTHYAAVLVQDTHDHWSALSNEKSAKANVAVTPPENDGLWAHRLGKDSAWTEGSPTANFVAWTNVTLYWKDSAYTITAGNTDKKYIWWDYDVSTTTFQKSDTKPTLTYQDVLVATTDGAGKLYLTMYSPMVIADFVRAGVLESTNWTTTTGSYFDLDLGTIKLGGSSDPSFSVDTDGLMTAKEGLIAGFTIHETDGLYAGSVATRVQMKPGAGFWAGATARADAPFSATEAGVVTAGGFTISAADGIYAGTGVTRVQMKPGAGFWAGATTQAAAPFSVDAAGNMSLGVTIFTWTVSTSTAIMQGTTKTANSGERLAIFGSGTDAHKLIAYDATGHRIALDEAEIRIYKADTTTTLSVFPSTPATAAHIGNDEVIVDETLIVGRSTDPSTADKLHVTGTGLFTDEVVVGDHNEGVTPSVANVLFYTVGNIPDADTVPRGTIAFQVPA